MARPPHLDFDTYAKVSHVINVHADLLSECYENLDVPLAREALEKLFAAFGREQEYQDGDKWLVPAYPPPFSLLDLALEHCPPNVAVGLVLQSDVNRLARRVAAAEYLVSEDTPLSTLSQLADRLHGFADYLESDREHLVKTGLPRRCFRPCRWMYRRLARLYDVRRTDCPYPLDEFSRSWREDSDAYTWVRYVPVEVGPDHWTWGLSGLVEPEKCAYGEADLLKGMRPEDAARIEAGRPKLFDLKVRLLRLLANSAQRRDGEGIWDRCRTDKLTCPARVSEL
jgi:hypothetical protein